MPLITCFSTWCGEI